MIPWATARPALVELIGSIAHDQDMVPKWAHRAQPFESPTLQQSVFLRVASVVTEGAEAESYSEDEHGVLHESTSGHRLITLEIRCESNKELDGEWSFQTAERIRTRLRRQASHQALLAHGMCLVETNAALDASFKNDERTRNVAQFDAILRCTFDDVNPDPACYWDKVLVTSNLKQADGTSVATPPNYSNEQLPPS